MANELEARGVKDWALQAFRASGCANESLVDSASSVEALTPTLIRDLTSRVPGLTIR
jgi:hypothetical protein